MSHNQKKLKELLRELFQLDSADLDFGIYRIMNTKREEIERFLDEDLLPQVNEAFQKYKSSDSAQLKADLDKLIQQMKDAGVDPDLSPKVKDLREKLSVAVDVSALENQVFSDLYNFFRRYYNEGDFLSLRRYKEGVYAIPYEGEEVKLHWANHDQYYIKTSEYLRDYAFKLPDGRRVHFRLAAADTEKDNNKANGNDRRFILAAECAITEENGELVIRFEFRQDSEKRRQDALNAEAAKTILEAPAVAPWLFALAALAPTESDPNRTVLAKHLKDYTARNTFDYFIHKDAGRFLRRELDFFIKNEVMHLDDIENASAPSVEQYLSRIRVLRRIAHKIIEFLAQIEDFQKRLWLKKKFVVETQYCVTLDRLPDALYPAIAANEGQHQEWIRLFAINEIQGDLINPKYESPLTVEFLKANQNLVLDTCFFDGEFKRRLLASIEDLDAIVDGVLIHGDNFQALRLLGARLEQQVRCVYIDPPYNTASSAILYKNDYKHSSFASMMRDRLAMLRSVLAKDGAIFVSIDKTERTIVEHMLDDTFGADNHIEELIWTQNTANSQLPTYSTNHEYVEVYARDRKTVEADPLMFREPKPGFAEIMALLREIGPSYPPLSTVEEQIKALFLKHIVEFQEEVEGSGQEWDSDSKRQDSWRGIYPYNRAEYRDASGKYVDEAQARAANASLWIWSEISAAAPASKQSPTTKDRDHYNFRYYKPIHPKTGKPCAHPRSGWKFPFRPDPSSPSRKSFMDLDADRRIAWGEDEQKLPRTKGFLHEVETNIGTSVFYEYNDGENELTEMFGEPGLFLSPKSSKFVRRFIVQVATRSDYVLDVFGGSGSTAHAVISVNRGDKGKRKYIVAEVGDHFEGILKPRTLKAVYAARWREGKPLARDSGQSHCIKVLRIESYEDALNNLELKRSGSQQSLLNQHPAFREDYTLRYMLDVESRGSTSLLNVERFDDPFVYQLNISKGTVGEMEPKVIDLVETFNYLVGLRPKTMDQIGDVFVVTGLNPAQERVLILWRKTKEVDSDALDAWFQKQGYNTKDMEFDLIYVNGDNNLENLKKDEDRWKVRLIEEEFARLMFDVQEV